ncbi:hypothetical protein LTR37_020150, partial [Vermiconidia calcicola]
LEEDGPQEPPTPGRPFSGRNSVVRERSASASNMSHNRRGASPQLEHEERDFKQTANALYEQAQQRRNSLQSQQDVNMEPTDATVGAEQDSASVSMSIEESDEGDDLKKINEDATALFGHVGHLKAVEQHTEMFSSPLIEPQHDLQLEIAASKMVRHEEPMDGLMLGFGRQSKDIAVLSDWETLQSPENIELAELEDMFDAY